MILEESGGSRELCKKEPHGFTLHQKLLKEVPALVANTDKASSGRVDRNKWQGPRLLRQSPQILCSNGTKP